MNIEERVQIAILSKYYGKMLTEKQQNVLAMYVDNNLSLAEVSVELGISRQAVKDALDNSMQTLKSIEEKLQFISRDDNIKHTIEENKSIEYKSVFEEDIKHEILGFLNTSGGIIYVGINDDKTINKEFKIKDTMVFVKFYN